MLPSIAKHANNHGIVPIKKYGQNFIFDATLCDKIVRASNLQKDSIVLEIGPGTGGLTRSILAHFPQSLTVIETDTRCLNLLEEIKTIYPNLHILHIDARKFDLLTLQGSKKIDIIANLPYHIGTELVIKWLKNSSLINSMTLMLQKEVVDRMKALPGDKTYGRLSIICQLICKVEKCFDVSRHAFYPSPKVDSSIVRLVPYHNDITATIFSTMELITRHAFSERRKMIKTSLKKLIPEIIALLNILGIAPSCRAENLSLQDYLHLAQLMNK